jgi:hypothetical protein
MAEKFIWLIGGGALSLPMVRLILERGYRPLITDGDPHCPARSYAEFFRQIDTYSIGGHRDFALELSTNPDYAYVTVHGVLTCGADVACTVQVVQQILDMKPMPMHQISKLNNKLLFRQSCHGNDKIRDYSPSWFVSLRKSPDDPNSGYDDVRYPCVVKPTDSRASRGVSRVEAPEELAPAIAYAFEQTQSQLVIAEEAMTGTEHSCELILDEDGLCVFFNIVDRLFDGTLETGHINPSRLPVQQQIHIHRMMHQVAHAFDLKAHILKADIMMVDGKAKILETATRLSGGYDAQATTPMSSGRNPMGIMLSLATKTPFRDDDIDISKNCYAACMAAFPPPGQIAEFDCETAVELIEPDLQEVFVLTQTGDTIEPYHHCGQRPAFVVSVDPDYDTALAKAKNAAQILTKCFRIHTQGGQVPSNPDPQLHEWWPTSQDLPRPGTHVRVIVHRGLELVGVVYPNITYGELVLDAGLDGAIPFSRIAFWREVA